MGSAELLKVHGLWDQSSGDFNKKTVNEEEAKNIRGSLGKSQLDRLMGIKELDWD